MDRVRAQRPAKHLVRDLVATGSNDEIGSDVPIAPTLHRILPRSSKSKRSLAITAGEGWHT